MALHTRSDTYDDAAVAVMTDAFRRIVETCDADPTREGLVKTPERAAKAMAFLTSGSTEDPESILRGAVFEEPYNEMVLVKDIELFSLCEHHLLPFFGRAHVAYIPAGRIVGLSKIPRMVDVFARRLQVQERLTVQVRDCLQRVLAPDGVAVIIEARHLCMQMRGVEKQHSITTTSSFSGAFMDDPKTREELISLTLRGLRQG